MANTSTRLFTLLMLLQRQPNQKASGLAAELGISVRSLHRYIAMLDEMGIPVYSERGPYGGFSLVRGYRLPPMIFTPEEAVALFLGTSVVHELWGPLYEDAAAAALAKLENVLPDVQREEVAWARRSLITTGLHRPGLDDCAPALAAWRRAMRARARVRLLYVSGTQSTALERCVDPYALVHRWGWWYAIGYCHLRSAVRSFRVDRIREIAVLDEHFEIPADFDVQRHARLENAVGDQPRVVLRFEPDMAHVAAANRALWDSMAQAPDGTLEVSVRPPDLTWAASFALSYGPGVTVLEPEALRDIVAEWAAAVAARYRRE